MKTAGRPTKRPGASFDATWGTLSIVADYAREILAKYKAPQHWGEAEIETILILFRSPGMLNAEKPDPIAELATEKRRFALRFARMFAEAPATMTRVIQKLGHKIQKLLQSPETAVIAYYGIACDLAKAPGNNGRRRDEFWNAKANLLQGRIAAAMGVRPSIKTIEHARARLRKASAISP